MDLFPSKKFIMVSQWLNVIKWYPFESNCIAKNKLFKGKKDVLKKGCKKGIMHKSHDLF